MTPPARVRAALDPEVLLALSPRLVLKPDTVHVWAFTLEGSADLVEACREVLSLAERQRADRFVFARDRTRHVIAHGVLRHLLSRYCGFAPSSLRFDATSTGKPSLQTSAGQAASLHFNLSHSETGALLGVSSGRELGVDLERVRSDVEALGISRHYFFGSERKAIEEAHPAGRDTVFFRYWVAKEAVLKAQGVGLGFPLDRFCVNFLPEGQVAHIETLDPGVLEPDWTVRMLPCDIGWVGAVAARGDEWSVKVERPEDAVTAAL